jgi:methionyl aminopeptidase
MRRDSIILGHEDRDRMRAACRFNAQLMDFIRPQVKEGVTTGEIDRLIHQYTLDHGHRPATLGYKGYPKSCCTSVNEVICHGIPGPYVLKNGDIVNVDITSIVNGWYGDQSETIMIGTPSDEARRLVQNTFECLWKGIEATRPFGRIIEIGRAIRSHAESHGFSVVRDYQGHGLGREFHQEPSIPHYPMRRLGLRGIPPGVCFTIEPMINAGTEQTELDESDHWTVRTRDRKLSAQFEHTILMTETGPEVLTLTKEGPQKGHKF